MRRTKTTCSYPTCDAPVDGGRCPDHRPPDRRPSAAARGYGPAWRATRDPFIDANPRCVLCGRTSEVADHHPYTRVELVELGVPDPDDWRYLRALCASCHGTHGRKTPESERNTP